MRNDRKKNNFACVENFRSRGNKNVGTLKIDSFFELLLCFFYGNFDTILISKHDKHE